MEAKTNSPESRAEKHRIKAIRDQLKEMSAERKKLTEELASLREKNPATPAA